MAKVRRMRTGLRSSFALAATLLLGGTAGAEAHIGHNPHKAAEPVVVELYTAQGCSGCGKVDSVIGDLAGKKDLIPLAFSVDYWDYLGWEDTWAKSEFADRQRAYVARLRVREIYTPEIVVQGAAEAPAWDQAKVNGLIAQAEAQRRPGPRIQFLRQGARVRIGGLETKGYQRGRRCVVGPLQSSAAVGEGEVGRQQGQTVTVKNAVHELKKLGVWRGGLKTYLLPKAEDAGLKAVVLIPGAAGRPHLGGGAELMVITGR